ncbi:MAG: hypothetical protein IPL49_07190 [Saprospirales bacterium]|nr:hypothetical protein [Saprospirales bacterium]MBK8490675.1 hypothetical protein [Saprospirales bacterium]
MYRLIALTVFSLLFLTIHSCKVDNVPPVNCDNVSDLTYNGAIGPIIKSSCAISGCHNSKASHGSLETYSQISPYLKDGTIQYYVVDLRYMPPSSHKLSSNDLQLIQCWLEAGYPEN